MISAKRLTIPEGRVGSISADGQIIWTTDTLPITAEDMLVKYTGADLVHSLNLQPGSWTGKTDAEYFTFKHIPIVPGARYYAQYSTRSWFLKSDKTGLKTCNPRTCSGSGSSIPYEFVAPEDAYYISISYNYGTVGSPDVPLIRRIE